MPAPSTSTDKPGEWLTCIDADPQEKRVAIGRSDGAVVVVEVARGPKWSAKLHAGRVTSTVYDGDLLWSAAFDGEVVCSHALTAEIKRRFPAQHGRVLSLRTAGAYDLVTVGDDGHARMWDRASGTLLQTLEEKRFGAAYSIATAAQWLVIGYQDGHVAVWLPGADARSWKYDGKLQPPGRAGSPVYAIAVSRDATLVAFARDRRVLICEAGSWRRIAELQCDLACNDLQFNAAGDEIIGACSEHYVRRWRRREQAPRGWDIFGDTFGAGLAGAPWEQRHVYSGARYLGQYIVAAGFDGQMHRFDTTPTPYPHSQMPVGIMPIGMSV